MHCIFSEYTSRLQYFLSTRTVYTCTVHCALTVHTVSVLSTVKWTDSVQCTCIVYLSVHPRRKMYMQSDLVNALTVYAALAQFGWQCIPLVHWTLLSKCAVYIMHQVHYSVHTKSTNTAQCTCIAQLHWKVHLHNVLMLHLQYTITVYCSPGAPMRVAHILQGIVRVRCIMCPKCTTAWLFSGIHGACAVHTANRVHSWVHLHCTVHYTCTVQCTV